MVRIATPALNELLTIVWTAWKQVLAATSLCQVDSVNDRSRWSMDGEWTCEDAGRVREALAGGGSLLLTEWFGLIRLLPLVDQQAGLALLAETAPK